MDKNLKNLPNVFVTVKSSTWNEKQKIYGALRKITHSVISSLHL